MKWKLCQWSQVGWNHIHTKYQLASESRSLFRAFSRVSNKFGPSEAQRKVDQCHCPSWPVHRRCSRSHTWEGTRQSGLSPTRLSVGASLGLSTPFCCSSSKPRCCKRNNIQTTFHFFIYQKQLNKNTSMDTKIYIRGEYQIKIYKCTNFQADEVKKIVTFQFEQRERDKNLSILSERRYQEEISERNFLVGWRIQYF